MVINANLKNLLYSVERYCNNYFNPQNDPKSKIRKYPPAFLELVEDIRKFNDRQAAAAIEPVAQSISEADRNVTFAADPNISNPWQQVFGHQLSIYKRVKII